MEAITNKKINKQPYLRVVLVAAGHERITLCKRSESRDKTPPFTVAGATMGAQLFEPIDHLVDATPGKIP